MSATPLGPVQVTERLEISAAGLPTSPAPGSHTTSQNEAIVSGGRSARRLLDIAAGAAFCLPFILYYVNVIRYGVDVPIQDDYGTFLGTVLNWLRAPGLVERLSGIVAQHNEHRVAFDRLVALGEYYLTGRLNFNVLILFGTLGWVLSILLLAFILVKKQGLKFVELLPLPYFLLMFTQNGNMFMATTAITFYWEIFFTLVAFICLAERKIVYACLMFAVTFFTSGNGVLLFPVGVLYLLIFRRWKEAILYSVSCLIFAALYFTNYHPVSNLSLGAALGSLGTVFAFPFAFIGNISPQIYPPVVPAVIVGAIASVCLVYFVVRRTGAHFLLLTATWILGTAPLAAITRYSFGLELAVSSRYAQFSALAIVLIYVWMLTASRIHKTGPFQPRYVVSAAFLTGAALFGASVMDAQRTGAFALLQQAKISGLSAMALSGDTGHLAFPDQFQAAAGQALIQARQLGFYDYLQVLNLRLPVTTLAAIDASAPYDGHVEAFDGMYLSGWILIPKMDSSRSTITVLLRTSQYRLGLDVVRIARPDVARFYGKPLYASSGYGAYLAAYAVPPGSYEIGVMIANAGRRAIAWTGDHYATP